MWTRARLTYKTFGRPRTDIPYHLHSEDNCLGDVPSDSSLFDHYAVDKRMKRSRNNVKSAEYTGRCVLPRLVDDWMDHSSIDEHRVANCKLVTTLTSPYQNSSNFENWQFENFRISKRRSVYVSLKFYLVLRLQQFRDMHRAALRYNQSEKKKSEIYSAISMRRGGWGW